MIDLSKQLSREQAERVNAALRAHQLDPLRSPARVIDVIQTITYVQSPHVAVQLCRTLHNVFVSPPGAPPSASPIQRPALAAGRQQEEEQ